MVIVRSPRRSMLEMASGTKTGRSDHALRQIEQFLRAHNMKPTRFGREAVNDPRLVHDMRNGRALGAKQDTKVKAYIARYEA